MDDISTFITETGEGRRVYGFGLEPFHSRGRVVDWRQDGWPSDRIKVRWWHGTEEWYGLDAIERFNIRPV